MAAARLLALNLSLHTHRSGWVGSLYKPVSVLQYSMCYGHFLPIQHPIRFLSHLVSWLLCQLWSQSGQLLWASLVCSSRACRDPPAASVLHCPQWPQHSPEESSQCRKTGTIFMQSHNLTWNTAEVAFQPESLLNT